MTMAMDFIEISDFKISCLEIPTETPESDGTLDWSSTSVILVELKAANQWSLGYTYGNLALGFCVRQLIEQHVLRQNALDIPLIGSSLLRRVRNDGRFGLTAMAISAIDNSLWDLKAKILNLSLVQLLGGAKNKIEVYGSGGFTSYDLNQLDHQLMNWAELGIKQFKIKIGTHPDDDFSRAQFCKKSIGDKRELMVDANEAYDKKFALQMAYQLNDLDVKWFEQPIDARDYEGMRDLKADFPPSMNLTTGEYIYDASETRRHLQTQCVDILQLDATRCKGITGFLQSAALCEAYNIPISSHCAPALHVALGCHLSTMLHIEYFFDHSRIENKIFEGAPQVKNGFLSPDLSRLGLGLELKRKDIEEFIK